MRAFSVRRGSEFAFRFVCLCCLCFGTSPARGEDPSPLPTIILVRHAEKESLPGDPPLTSRGKEQAQYLAEMLGTSGIDRIFVSQYRRTQQTAVPLSEALGIHPEIIPVNHDSLGRYLLDLFNALKEKPSVKTVLVVSHSNVIPSIIRELGVGPPIEIPEHLYGDMFIVTGGGTRSPHMLRLRYAPK